MLAGSAGVFTGMTRLISVRQQWSIFTWAVAYLASALVIGALFSVGTS